MRIAIACSGLGHVQRGIEAWAKALAEGLHREGVDVVLFHGAPRESPASEGSNRFECPNVTLDFRKRDDGFVRNLTRLAPGFTWRWGWKSAYAFEQRSFARALRPYLNRRGFNIVHTQDPVVADQLEQARRRGVITARTILGHGTNEDPEYLRRFQFLQHISPAHESAARAREDNRTRHFCIPNFIDTNFFRPGGSETWARDCRRKLGIDDDAFVVGCAGVLVREIKRMDVLIPEVAALGDRENKLHLVMAGAPTADTGSIRKQAGDALGDRCTIIEDLPFGEMPGFYGALDLLVLPCLIETFGIVLLEAMACGVPVVAHNSPTLTWVVGPGGWCVDAGADGFLSTAWDLIKREYEDKRGVARSHVEQNFSLQAVGPKFLDMYHAVADDRARNDR